MKLADATLWRGRKRLQQPFAAWPVVDQTRWNEAVAPVSILDLDGGRAAGWSPATRRTVIKAYGRWLAWLDSCGNLDPTQAPGDRITQPMIADYAASLAQTVGRSTVWSYLHGLAMAYEVLEPAQDSRWLWKIVGVFGSGKGASKRKRGRIVPSRDLFAYGVAVMGRADRAEELRPVAQASLFRDGLMIAMLAARPVRLKNFASIEIGTQLTTSGAGYCLHFDAAETKTKREIHVSIPEDLVGKLETYIDIYRPILLAEHGENEISAGLEYPASALWISAWGTRMSHNIIYVHISTLTKEGFGRSVNPHLFRDCAATSIALEDPAHVATTIHVIGHTSLTTSERYYNHAISRKACDTYQADIALMLRQARKQERGGRQKARKKWSPQGESREHGERQ